MRTMIVVSTVALAIAATVPAMAQQGDPSVSTYLCQFANKCDPATSATPGTTDPAPSAAPSPSVRVSATRGFRLGGGTPPAVTPPPAPVASPVRHPRFAVARPVPTPGAGATRRVNLRLNFEYNSDAMTPDAQGKARVFAQALITPELRDKRFLIEGHTDARGSRALNIDLSRRRAQSVANFLIAQGVDARNIDVRGVGAQVPLPGQPATAEANRRVEAVLIP